MLLRLFLLGLLPAMLLLCGGLSGALGQSSGALGTLPVPAAPSVVGAESGHRVDGLTQTEAGQQQLRSTTSRVGEQLGAIIEEFGRSGLGGEDVQLLGSIRGLLGHLSEEDMARVVELLQQARGGEGVVARRTQLLEAFSTQKSVGLKLRQILLEYQRQQELAGVAARLEELAAREQSSLRETVGLAATAAGRKREWLSENQRILLQLQVREQQSVRDEAASVLQRLRSWKGAGADAGDNSDDSVARAAEAMAGPEAARVARLLEGALVDLNNGRLLSAIGRQRAARVAMRDLARQLVPPADELEALQAGVRDLDAWIARQEAVRGVTRELVGKRDDVSKTVQQQVDLLDDVDFARRIIGGLDATAGEQVTAAAGRMQEARGVIEAAGPDLRLRRLSAATQQEMAEARLGTARRLLQERLDSLEKQRAAASDPQSNLKQVRSDVAELLRLETALKSEAAKVESDPLQLRPLAPRQGDLGDRSQDAGARAALDSPTASEQLAVATRQMRGSQKGLGEGRNQAGLQQAAIDALGKALESLDKQLAELEKAQAEVAELEKLLERLIVLIEQQQGLNSETARLARKVQGRSPGEVGREQSGLQVETRKLQGDLPDTVPQAITYVDDAATQMILAGNELAAARPSEARSSQDEALADLQRARRELEDRLAALKEMLGMPQDPGALEKLAQTIKQAQADVNSAMSAEELANMGKGLKNAQKRIQPATSGRMGRMPRSLREALQRAEQALNEGSAAAEGQDQAAAETDAGQAQEALAAAAAAVDLAMAGMGQPGEGEGQGGQGNQPGQGQGKGRGKVPGSRSGKGTGDAGNFFGSGGADGPRRNGSGAGRFIGLPPRERAALLQSQGEHYPQEYAPMIEQYLKNLSDQVQGAPK